MTGADLTAAQSRALERIERVCVGASDSVELREALVGLVRRSVGFDAYAWLLTDPQTRVGTSPLADVPCLPELPDLIRLKYLTSVNRWTALPGRGVGLLLEATGGDPSQSLLWRDLLCRYDVRDVASVAFIDRFGCWGFLDLWRSGDSGSRPFGGADAEFLSRFAKLAAPALRRAQARAFAVAPPDVGLPPGPHVLLLSPQLQVRAQTAATQELLRALVPPSSGQAPIPASALNVAAQLLAREAGVDDSPAWARVHVPGGSWLTLRAARFGDSNPAGDRDIAVTLEASSASERLGVFTRAFGFSSRESQLAEVIMSGAPTREAARRMTLSEHTVQDHLKAMFAKVGVNSRIELVSRVLGA